MKEDPNLGGSHPSFKSVDLFRVGLIGVAALGPLTRIATLLTLIALALRAAATLALTLSLLGLIRHENNLL